MTRCPTPQDTLRYGAELGATLSPGDVVSLRGPLGAGKTQLVHGIVQGYFHAHQSSPPPVCSPSYTIVNTYETDEAVIHHIDLYRLRDFDDLESTGYWDVLEDPDAVILIEWLEQIEGAAPPAYTEIEITLEDESDPHRSPRHFTLTPILPATPAR